MRSLFFRLYIVSYHVRNCKNKDAQLPPPYGDVSCVMRFIHPQKLTLFCVPPHPAPLTLRHLPHQGEGSQKRLLPLQGGQRSERPRCKNNPPVSLRLPAPFTQGGQDARRKRGSMVRAIYRRSEVKRSGAWYAREARDLPPKRSETKRSMVRAGSARSTAEAK